MSVAEFPKIKLYHYWRSSSSWRVRWAFQLKGIHCEMQTVNLLSDESESSEHRARNPMGYVPALEFLEPRGHQYLAESTALMEWAEEVKPEPKLLPGNPRQRARIRQLVQIINAGTQPIQNLNVQIFHSSDLQEQKKWNAHWIRNGLEAYEKLVQATSGKFSVGDGITMADLCLIPQCYNALRNDVALSDFPTVASINEAALATEACQASHPDRYAPTAKS